MWLAVLTVWMQQCCLLELHCAAAAAAADQRCFNHLSPNSCSHI
jgi:hypothetical protein